MWICDNCSTENTEDHHWCFVCGPLNEKKRSLLAAVMQSDGSCIDCRKIIKEGQIYVPTNKGPEHVGCGEGKRLVKDRYSFLSNQL